MSPQLKQKFAELDARLESMVNRVESMPEKVQTAPFGKSYSPKLTIEHMAKVDESYFTFIEKATLKPLPKQPSEPNFIYRFVLKKMQEPANKIAPVTKEMAAEGKLTVQESAEKWRSARKKIVAFLDKFEDTHPAIKHPLFGKMSPTAIYVLMEKHQGYHDIRMPQ